MADRLARAAEALVGTPFRLHGRDPVRGIDCLGLLACALEACGSKPVLPRGYSLRMTGETRAEAFARANGFVRGTGDVLRGDLLLVAPGPGQHHLLCAIAPGTCVHAHAGLGQVVRQAIPAHWPILHHWRLAPPPTG